MSTNPRARAWVEVETSALLQNAATLEASIGPASRLIPMVKANAYGLGVAGAVLALQRRAPWGFGVAPLSEGLELLDLGGERPILVASPLPPGSVDAAVEAGLHLGVSNLDGLGAAEAAGSRLGRAPSIHLEIDTGIGRAGFDWARAAEWGPKLATAVDNGVRWVGTYTHFHSADENITSVREQWSRFQEVIAALGAPEDGLVHAVNSAAALRAPELGASAARTGIFLFGGSAGKGLPAPQPVVSVRARVVHLRTAETGVSLGYGATHRAKGDESWATLAIGYGDGLPRALGNRGSALIDGHRVPIIGRISMDVTVVDISHGPNVSVGDVATLIGSDGDHQITVDDVAEQAGTISYEVLTGLTQRLPRIWTDLDGL